MRPAITTKAWAYVVASSTALATRRLTMGEFRSLLRVAAYRVPALAVISSAFSLIRPSFSLEVSNGVLGITAP